MDAILIANVGNSDLAITGRIETPVGEVLPTESKGYNYREAAERLFSLGHVPDGVQFPLMEKYLRFIDLHGYRLKRVYLFGTDQSENAYVGERFKAQDTFKAAKLLKLWLQQIKPGLPVEVFRVTENPSDWDTMNGYFSRRLQNLRVDAETCLVAITGGPQAMNAMLLLHATNRLPNVTLISASETHDFAKANRLGRELKRQELITQVISHLRQQDYYGALGLLEGSESLIEEKDRFRLVHSLLLYAHLRTAFRFREAAATANRAMQDARNDAHMNLLARLSNEAGRLDAQVLLLTQKMSTRKADDAQAALRLHEIVSLAEWYAKRGQLLVVVGLVYSFADVAANVGLRNRGASMREGSHRLSAEWVASHPGLEQYLAEKEVNWRDLNVNPRIATAILAWFGEHGDDSARFLAEAIGSYQPVQDLRNRTPVAHGTRGISEEDIAFAGGVPALLQSMRKVAEELTGPAPAPWSDDLIKVVEELLRS